MASTAQQDSFLPFGWPRCRDATMLSTLQTNWPTPQCGYAINTGSYDTFTGSTMSYADQIANFSYYESNADNKWAWRIQSCAASNMPAICEVPSTAYACSTAPPPSPPTSPLASSDSLCKPATTVLLCRDTTAASLCWQNGTLLHGRHRLSPSWCMPCCSTGDLYVALASLSYTHSVIQPFICSVSQLNRQAG